MANNERFKILRETIGVTQEELANSIGVAPSFISGIERNKKDISRNLLKKLLDKYKININWLLSGEGEMFLSSVPARIENKNSYKIPLLSQKVSCGDGTDWQDDNNIVDYIDIFDQIPQLKIERLFALCVEGSSMIGAGIRNGDYVLFNSAKDQWVRDGIYVIALDGEVLCKRLEFDVDKIKIYSVRFVDLDKAELVTTLDSKDISTADRLTILGRVLYWIHPNLYE